MQREDLANILTFWFPTLYDYQSFWFDKSKDEYIIDTYGHLLREMEILPLSFFLQDNHTLNEKLAYIILFDQFSRSIYRNKDKDNINKNDQIALGIVAQIIEQENDVEMPIIHRMFLLMPFRHQKKSDSLDFVLKKIRQYLKYLKEINEREIKLLKRFQLATYSSYTPLIDRIPCVSYNDEYDFSVHQHVLDPVYMSFIKRSDFMNVELCKLYQTLLSFVTEHSIKNIGISLSGGVDSMVTMFLCKILQNSDKIDHVYAIHLEYSNRKESQDETRMISMYCDMIGVPLYVRKIDYMSRDDVDRNFYEEETKKVRFHTYRYLNALHHISGWCLGHHYGDLAENVFMNLSNGRTLLDLSVMKPVSTIDHVNLYRPFLFHEKIEIYSFAYDFCIPYLKDSTPDWSCRGVFRRKVLPEIKKQWPSIEHTLCEIGQQSNEWNDTVQTFILDPIKKDITIDQEKRTIQFELKDEYKRLPSTIWLNLFLYMFHSIGIHMISHKNLTQFLNMFEHNLQKQHRFVFSNGCMGFFMKNCLRIIHINK